MSGLVIVFAGLCSAVVGWALLRHGSGWRIGRLLSAAPQHSLSEAADMAARGREAYIRLHGRIDSEEEFLGDDAKPIVFRRRRLQRRGGQGAGRASWHTFDDERQAVPFGLSERGERVLIDVDALGDGLVVVPRMSTGVAADLFPEAAGGPLPEMPADTPVVLRLEQVSAVDHGTACGVPRLTASGQTILGPGLGRPLILTTLDLDEAMRVLGSARRSSLLTAAGLLLLAPVAVAVGLLMIALGL